MLFRITRRTQRTDARPAARRTGRRFGLDPRGQSMVEFALSAPVVLLMVLFGVDFGRVFLGWVSLTNAARAAANFAAINPTAWGALPNSAAQAEFVRRINAETNGINCTLPAELPDPTFPSGTALGSPAVVTLTCRFSLITPIIGNVLGSSIPVSVTASFPIRSGIIAGVPTSSGGALPTINVTPTPFVPIPTPTVAPTPTPAPTIAPTPTPVPFCTVPDFKSTSSSTATATWTAAGFSANNLTFNPLVPPHYTIKHQSLVKGKSVLCTSTMTVTP
jgi:Flp pilus assembly protein TadG